MPRYMVRSASVVTLALGVAMTTLSVPASAGWTFRCLVSSRGTGLETTQVMRVWVEGAKYRIETEHEPDVAVASDVLISTDGGKSEIALNREDQTWFDNGAWRGGSGASSRLFQLPFARHATPRNVRLDLTDLGDGSQFEGWDTRRYVLRLSYDLEAQVSGETVPVRVDMTANTTTVPSLEEIRFVMPELRLSTGFPETDHALSEKMKGMRGLPVDFKRSVTQLYEGGEGSTELRSCTVTGIEAVQIPGTAFERPKNFRFQMPVMIGPGLTPH